MMNRKKKNLTILVIAILNLILTFVAMIKLKTKTAIIFLTKLNLLKLLSVLYGSNI